MIPACCAPFAQLSLQPNGKIFPCCYHQGYPVGNIQHGSWDEVWNSPKIQKLRKDLLSDHPKICKARMHHLSCHKEFEHLRSAIEPNVVQSNKPIRLDVRLNGKCNLRCIMCDVWEMENQLYDESFFWQKGPTEIFPFLKEIEILGGEPFIQEDTFKLIESIYTKNPDCQFGFVTNGHYNAAKIAIPILQKIKLKYLQISIDTLDSENFARVRRDGNLALVLKSLAAFQNLRERNDFELRASMTIVRQNIHEATRFIAFCFERSIKPVIQIAFHDPSGESALKFANPKELFGIFSSFESLSDKELEHIGHLRDYVAFLLSKNSVK